MYRRSTGRRSIGKRAVCLKTPTPERLPPFGCFLSPKQPALFTEEQIANAQNGKIDDKNVVKWVDFTNPRTGEIVRVPDNVTPSFAHNHGDRLGSLLNVYADKHGDVAQAKLTEQLDAYILGKLGDEVKVVDFSGVVVDTAEVERLLYDKDTGKDKPWEAIPAAQWQQYFGVRLERYDLVAKEPPDFLIIEDGVARDKLQTLDFMYTMDGKTEYNIRSMNNHFMKNARSIRDEQENIIGHLNKAKIVPMDLRYLTATNRIKLLSYVLSLPKEQKQQIVLIIGKLS